MARTMTTPVPITENLIALLRKRSAKPVSGRGKLGFPTSAPCPWAKLSDGTILRAEERGDVLVAV
jgi:hypothetical protein